jgi:uncharacterized membrane protein
MHFTHEVDITVEVPARDILSQWTEAHALPKYLSHIRATALDDSSDIARLVIVLNGHHIEFPAQRTMCSDDMICWQNLSDNFEYILTVQAKATKDATRVTINVSYDPPGFIFDVAEALGLSKVFRRNLESDLASYAACCQPAMSSAMAV